MSPNPGHLPDEARGKRVRGLLNNGRAFGREASSPTAPVGWDADRCGWAQTGDPFQIAEFEVIG